MLSQSEIRKQITEKLIAALENGVMPWRRPWKQSKNTGRPANVVSKRPYSGINPLLLELDSMKKGFSSRYWATFNQWRELGCCVEKRPDSVKAGQWGTNIILFRPFEKATTDPKTGEEKEGKFFSDADLHRVQRRSNCRGRTLPSHRRASSGERQPDSSPLKNCLQNVGRTFGTVATRHSILRQGTSFACRIRNGLSRWAPITKAAFTNWAIGLSPGLISTARPTATR